MGASHGDFIMLNASAEVGADWLAHAQAWVFGCIQTFRFLQPHTVDHPAYKRVMESGRKGEGNQLFMVRSPASLLFVRVDVSSRFNMHVPHSHIFYYINHVPTTITCVASG